MMPSRKIALVALIPAALAMTACGIERRHERREDRRDDRRDRREEISRAPGVQDLPAAGQALYWRPASETAPNAVVAAAPLA